MSFHLGVNVFHDVGIAVVDSSGKPLAIYEETKFTGRKEEYLQPFLCLDQLKKDGFSSFASVTWPIDISEMKSGRQSEYTQLAIRATDDFEQYINKEFSIEHKHTLEHHRAHAESVFFASGFENAHILVIDGAGEEQSISIFNGNRYQADCIQEIIRVPRQQFSYGHLYGLATSYLGYSRGASNTHCGKIMGLSSYGEPKYCSDFIELFTSAGHFFPEGHTKIITYLTERFGSAFAIGEKFSKEQADIAASIQSFLEHDLLRILKELPNKYPDLISSRNLCIAGGVGMNSVANGKILFSGIYDDIFVQPAATDAGIAYGAAHYGARKSGNSDLARSFWQKANWGFNCQSSLSDVQKLIYSYNLPLSAKTVTDVPEYLAAQLHDSKIVAVCRNQQEIGERALGYRSILSLPSEYMRDKVNQQVKYRESWRPFAPILSDSFIPEIFPTHRPEPFMSIVYPMNNTTPPDIQGIVHVDNTARLQTVNQDVDPLISQTLALLKSQYSRSPVIINTSFNINGQSMVRTDYDALVTFMSTGIDQLLINDVLITKNTDEIFPKSSITPLDRALQSLSASYDKINIFYICKNHDDSSMLKAVLSSVSINRKFSQDCFQLNILSSYSSDKQRWYQESLLEKFLSKRIPVHSIPQDLSSITLSNSVLNLLITDHQVLPMKAGHLMTGYKMPDIEYVNSYLASLVDVLSDEDVFVDSQCRPIRIKDLKSISHISVHSSPVMV
ncbi:carbamoyltransferase C-terminal domain-containing protein [Synechococcus sp. MIT S9452]|uniref:carbamoyltransferase C-terminal domain-containing protein n=1 Tax=Synechococcus sp. MIT S9452 TaxID=3082546 RepID=UPI0039A73B25